MGCTWNRLANRSYTLIMMTISICIPCILIPIFYFKIFIYAFTARSRAMFNAHTNINQGIKETYKIAKGMFFSFVIFTICWLEILKCLI